MFSDKYKNNNDLDIDPYNNDFLKIDNSFFEKPKQDIKEPSNKKDKKSFILDKMDEEQENCDIQPDTNFIHTDYIIIDEDGNKYKLIKMKDIFFQNSFKAFMIKLNLALEILDLQIKLDQGVNLIFKKRVKQFHDSLKDLKIFVAEQKKKKMPFTVEIISPKLNNTSYEISISTFEENYEQIK